MAKQLSEAERWEEGCRADDARNRSVIPEVARLFAKLEPQRILDVGTGTGYIARQVHERLHYSPHWTLLDLDAKRLALADKACPSGMMRQCIASDVMALPANGQAFEAILVAFTLLEVPDLPGCITRLRALLSERGLLVVVMPDCWADVLKEDRAGADQAAEKFLYGTATINKVDKFTGERYPFMAIRMEDLVGTILKSGFILFELHRYHYEASSGFVLAFRAGSSHVP